MVTIIDLPCFGCTNVSATNYNPFATVDDGSCVFPIFGCTDPSANNFNPNANTENGSCTYDIFGCTDPLANNFSPDAKEPFSALAFKIMTDPFVGRLAFFRCYSGHLDAGSYVLNVRSGKKERISRIMKMFANKQNPVDFIEAGDIAAAVGFKEIKTGDTLCDENHPITLENMFIPEPVIAVAVEPKTQADVDKMGMAIAKLVEEDPTLRVNTDEDTGQTILRGMGELHLDKNEIPRLFEPKKKDRKNIRKFINLIISSRSSHQIQKI